MANSNASTLRNLRLIQALTETIAEAGTEGAPSGVCYMALNGAGVDIETYQSYVTALVNAGLITNRAHLLRATPKLLKLLGQ